MHNILEAIGNTPLVRLEHIPNRKGAAVYVKLEYFNPTSSYKDRMALSMVEAAEQRGELKPGMTVIENTAGSTGTALAFVCAAKGYRFDAISSDAFSMEKLRAMQLFGANLELLTNGGAGVTPDIVPRMIKYASELSKNDGYFWTRQFENPDVLTGYRTMAQEIIEQAPRPIHAFCAAIGTAGMFVGVSLALKEAYRSIKLTALEPASAPLLSRGFSGTHCVEGIAPGFVPPFLKLVPEYEVLAIHENEGRRMATRLAKEEGVLAGTSTGLNVAAAVRIAKDLSPSDVVVTVACDSGLKYFSTDLYSV